MSVRTTIFKEEASRYIFNMTFGDFMRVILIGAGAGLATWVLALVLDRYMISPFFCGNDSNISICLNSNAIASNIAAILVGIMTVPILAVVSIKRVLLVVIAAVIALWGIASWVAGAWYVSLLWAVLAYAAVFAALVWINRLRSDVAAIIFITLFVFLIRAVVAAV